MHSRRFHHTTSRSEISCEKVLRTLEGCPNMKNVAGSAATSNFQIWTPLKRSEHFFRMIFGAAERGVEGV